jgi:hypothetical protein
VNRERDGCSQAKTTEKFPQKKKRGTDPNTPTGRAITCEILKKHNATLKDDPEHLSTEFMQKLIGIDCDKV